MNICHKSTGALEQTRFEKIHSVIFNDSKEASKIVAKEIADLIIKKQKQNKNCVLGYPPACWQPKQPIQVDSLEFLGSVYNSSI